MRGRVLASAVLLAAPVLCAPAASAAPAPAAPELCAGDVSRGAVPVAFPIEACVDGTGMTLRNDRDRPVVVTGRGEFGARVMVRAQNDALSDVVRRTSPSALVLLPGEVARWPIGSGAALLTVGPLPLAAAPEIAAVLGPLLRDDRPAGETQALLDSTGALVTDVALAGGARAACAEGRSFLGTAACDVTAAAAIGSAAAERLDRRTAAQILPRLLDPGAWSTWPPADTDWPADAEVTLRQGAAVAPRLPTPSGPPPAPVSGAEQSPAPSPAEPREPVARPAPAPARTTPPARTAPAPSPAPVPRPVPTAPPAPAVPPAPVPVPAPAPPAPPKAPPKATPPSWQELHDRTMARLRELAEAWEKAQQQAREQQRERDHDRGKGRGRGHR